jgi:hypothetical protein
LFVLDPVAKEVEAVSHVIIQPQQVLPPRCFTRKLRRVVEVSYLSYIRKGIEIQQSLPGTVDPILGNNIPLERLSVQWIFNHNACSQTAIVKAC